MQCTAQSKQNQRQCRRHAVPGARVCVSHGGKAPQVKAAARVRLAMAADKLMAELLKIATSSEDERVRLAAVNSALDRAGLGAKQELEISQEPTQFDALIATVLRRGENGALSSGARALPSHPEQPYADPDEDYNTGPDVEYDRRKPVRGYATDDGVVVDLPTAHGLADELARNHDRERVLAEKRPARTRTRQAARERQVLIDAGEPVPGETPTRWD